MEQTGTGQVQATTMGTRKIGDIAKRGKKFYLFWRSTGEAAGKVTNPKQKQQKKKKVTYERSLSDND